MDSLDVETQAPREYCFSVFVEAKKLLGMTKALRFASPSVGQFACFLALPAIHVGLQPYQIRILMRRNTWVCCGGLQSLLIRSIRSSPKSPELGPKGSVLLLASIACRPPCFLALALFLLLAFANLGVALAYSVMLAADASCRTVCDFDTIGFFNRTLDSRATTGWMVLRWHLKQE